MGFANRTIAVCFAAGVSALVGGCSSDDDGTPQDAPVSAAAVVRETVAWSGEGREYVSIDADQTHSVVRVWHPPKVLLEEQDLPQARQRAATAREAGRLYRDAESAIPIYLAILSIDAEDVVAQRGLAQAYRELLAEGNAVLQRAEEDDSALDEARRIAAVMNASVDMEDPESVEAFNERLEHVTLAVRDNRRGERELHEGRLGEGTGIGALGFFRSALAVNASDKRARQGLAATESAMLRHAEIAAQAADFEAAKRWLDFARQVRGDEAATVADAESRVEAVRRTQFVRLREALLQHLLKASDLAAAHQKMAEIERIALPGDPEVDRLRDRIELAVHYGVFRPGQVFTDVLKDGSRGPQMVVVPHGTFWMGAIDDERDAQDSERPRHQVKFERGFAMSLTEVTVGEYRRFVEATGFRPRATRRGNSTVYDERSGNFVRRSHVDWQSNYAGRPATPNDPVLHVSIRDAEAYAQWLSEQTGRSYRLPSEAEFEYALRAGERGRYPWGDIGQPPENSGNFTGGNDVSPSGRTWNNAFVGYGDGYWGPAPVGSFRPNAWGLHDLGGNVSEWVSDCWHSSYRRAPADGGSWYNPGCRNRVVRGGFWAGSPAQTRSAWRMSVNSDMTSARVGFRLVRGI